MMRGTDSRRPTSPSHGGQSALSHVADDFRPLAPFFRDLLTELSTADAAYDAAIDRASRYAATLSNDRDFGAVGTRIGGSVGKGTAIAPTSDVDLYVYLDAAHWNTRGQLLKPGTVVGRLYSRLEQRLTFELNNGYVTLRRQRHSVGIRFKKRGSVGIDVVPAIVDARDITEALIPRRKTDSYVSTSVERQMEIFNAKDSQFRFLRRGIRLLKFWSRQHDTGLPPYAVEIIGLHAEHNGCPRTELGVFIAALDFIGSTSMRVPVAIDYFFRYSPPRRRACIILDPAMPDNNVTDGWDASDGDRLGRAARFSLAKFRKALGFLARGRDDLAASCVSEAFGEEQ